LFNDNFVVELRATNLKERTLKSEEENIALEDELEAIEYGGFKL
jgi:hypothetical protein